MLAPKTRAAIRIGAVLYIVLGLVLFAAPGWSASVFPWSVTPLVAMTIGGWTLGNGIAAWFGSAPGPATRVMPVLVYLTAFAAAQLLVVIAFRAALKLDVILAVPYLLTLGFTLIAGAFGILELRSTTAIVLDEVVPLSRNVRLLLAGLTVLVGALAVGGFIAGQGGLSTTGKIFPEQLTLFTVRAFAAFYLALALSLVALLLRPSVASAFMLCIAGVALIVPILAAALLNVSAFDFAGHPLGLLYLGAYAVVLMPAAAFLWRHRDVA
ncbi:MAG: hypothetical protein HYX55_01935 [Chloroflexi bacterium]|nr:hypothetical protein [Chloroflexota bacterium]